MAVVQKSSLQILVLGVHNSHIHIISQCISFYLAEEVSEKSK